jgi:hypothetical protein
MAISQTKSAVENVPSPAGAGNRIWYLAIGAITITLVLSWLQASQPSVCCGDFDGYYHIKWSRMLWEGLRHGHLTSFEWLPLTTLNGTQYADQHFLYHLLLIPFTWFGDLRAGAKVGTVLFAIAAIFSLYWLVLLGLLACSWMFYVRVSMTRASGLSILFIVAGIFLLFEQKYSWLAPTAFLYVWTYNLFVMLLILAVLWAAALYWTERRLEWRPAFWSLIGTVAGFVIHPYFPRNLKLFWEHLAAKSSTAMQAGAGIEWYSLPTWDILRASMVASAAMVIGYLAYGYALGRDTEDRQPFQRATLFLLFSSFLLLIALRSVRFMEYWPPFAVLFAAFSLQSAWNAKQKTPQDDSTAAQAAGWRWIGVAVLLLLAALVYNLHTSRATMIAATKDPDHYKAATDWMRANLPSGALIYDINWSDFPKLFFYDTTHRYVSGLDPLYLQDRHPELEQLTQRLSHHAEPGPAAAIWKEFSAVEPSGIDYIFVGDYPAPPPPDWFAYIMRSGGFVRLYQDSECMILQLVYRPSQGETSNTPQMNDPAQRKGILPQVQRRFGKEVYATDDEDVKGGPALVIHSKQATAAWAQRVFANDSASISGELLWQLGFHLYVITNEKESWTMEVKGNPKFRGAFAQSAPSPKQ